MKSFFQNAKYACLYYSILAIEWIKDHPILFRILLIVAYFIVYSYIYADVCYCGDDIDMSSAKNKAKEIMGDCNCGHKPGVPCLDTPNHRGPTYEGSTSENEPAKYYTSSVLEKKGLCCRCGSSFYGQTQVVCGNCYCVLHKSCMTSKEISKLHD